MSMEAVILESRSFRRQLCGRTDALDKVKALTLLPDGVHVTTKMVADYFEVPEKTVKKVTERHRTELAANGMAVLRGSDLETFKGDSLSPFPGSYPQARCALTVFTRRAVLNVAMLLRDSDVARRVREHMLDVVEAGPVRARPWRHWSRLRWDEYETVSRDPAAEAWRRKIDGLDPFEVPDEDRLGSVERRIDAQGAVITALGERVGRLGEELRVVRGELVRSRIRRRP
ncbi:hypothetical protein GCM10010441_54380 [Kitasatospora paracochleata]|uniref:Uncharacterized protein n=1 Tax=Kitasatospora paracochleata TaxID=58354 RepID=A0ABT1J6X2_9ACTN|nr:hypothetical protein [Kitasatospora paracochleata]MCP2313185.1 hypothetical protein [Kitasatospora paracochleata]